MKHDPSNEPLENDPVWDLLREAPRREASAQFADNVVRAARLSEPDQPWWKRFWAPLALGGLATAATAAIAINMALQPPTEIPPSNIAEVGGSIAEEPASVEESFEALDEMVRTEALLVAADHPSAFSDAELVSLITY